LLPLRAVQREPPAGFNRPLRDLSLLKIHPAGNRRRKVHIPLLGFFPRDQLDRYIEASRFGGFPQFRQPDFTGAFIIFCEPHDPLHGFECEFPQNRRRGHPHAGSLRQVFSFVEDAVVFPP
jgi:hypothetical protein